MCAGNFTLAGDGAGPAGSEPAAMHVARSALAAAAFDAVPPAVSKALSHRSEATRLGVSADGCQHARGRRVVGAVDQHAEATLGHAPAGGTFGAGRAAGENA